MSNDETRIKVDTRPPAWAIRSLDGGDTSVHVVSDGYTVGRADDCSLILEESMLSRRHAKFTLRGHRLFVEDTSTNGTFVNDRRVEQAEVRDGDVIAFDELRYEVLIAENEQAQSTGAPARGRQRGDNTLGDTIVNPRRSRPAASSDLKRVRFRDKFIDEEEIEDPREGGSRPGPAPARSNAPPPRSSGSIMDEIMDELPPEPDDEEDEEEEEVAPAKPKRGGRRSPGLIQRIDAVIPVRHLAIFIGIAVAVVVPLVIYDSMQSGGEDTVAAAAPSGDLTQANQSWFTRLKGGNNFISGDSANLFGDSKPEIVLATEDQNLVFIDPADGRNVMSVQLPNKAVAPPMAIPAASGHNGYVVVPTDSKYLVGYDGAGSYLWATDFGRFSSEAEYAARPLMADPSIGVIGIKRRGLVLFELASGQILTDTQKDGFANVETKLALRSSGGADEIFAADSGGLLTGFRVSGREISVMWKSDLNELGNPSHVSLAGNKLIVSTTNGSVFAFDPATGDEIWKAALDTRVNAKHLIVNNQVVVLYIIGDMIQVDVTSGATTSKFRMANPVASDSTPHVVGDKIILKDAGGAIKAMDLSGAILSQAFVTDADSYGLDSLVVRLEGAAVSLISVSDNGVLARVDFN